jgi:hypothetical protein
MRTKEQHAGIVLEGMLGTIAMMHVPIHDQNALQAITFLSVTRRNGDIIEQAKSHGTLALGMMSRGPQGHKGASGVTFDNLIDCQQRPTYSQQGSTV